VVVSLLIGEGDGAMRNLSLLRAVLVIAFIGCAWICCASVQAGLLAYWSMDDGVGATIADNSGNGRNASFSGNAGWTTDGRFGNAARFTGSDDYVVTASSLPAIGTGDFSVSLWFRREGETFAGNWLWLLNSGQQGSGALVIAPLHDAQMGAKEFWPRVSMGSWFTDAVAVEGWSELNSSAWYNLVLTRSNSATTLFLNGTVVGTGTSTASLASYPVYLGGGVNSTSLVGAIDDVAIWNGALTADQVAAIANGTLSPSSFVVPEPGTLVLAVVGVIGLLAYAWRKQK
jgi:sialidase-1